ncbi:MAG TPA: hypothetical protein VG889_03595 [Rhizomicrobium sp.]|nr:hypothetical protein [Rhizomicrobium sp.]
MLTGQSGALRDMAPQKRAQTSAPLYTLQDIEADRIGDYPDGLQDICDGRVDGFVIHNAFSREEVERVAGRLTRRGPFPDAPFGNILIYGPALYVSESDLERYRREAVEFRRFCAETFRGGRDFEARIVEILAAMGSGRDVGLPAAPDGQPYTPATIRVLEVGQDMGWHFENQFLHATVGYRHLSTLINHSDHLSYFVVLETPKDGGDLVLYDLKWHQTEWLDKEKGGVQRSGTAGGRPIAEVMRSCATVSFRPPPGALVVFDGGNILHRVSAVEEAGRRVTIGGFIAFSKGRESVYYWS